MCLFITLLVPGDAVERDILNINSEPFRTYNNKSLSSQIPRNFIYGRATGSICDCDSIFIHRVYSQKNIKGVENDINKLIKKGWSQRKIERYKKDKEKSWQKNDEPGQVVTGDWFEYLKNLLEVKELKAVGLFTHYYSGSLETERLELKETIKVCVDDIGKAFLKSIEEDKLYIFIKNNGERA